VIFPWVSFQHERTWRTLGAVDKSR
jgi:hypothetical protein